MRLRIPILEKDGEAELVGLKSLAGGHVELLLKCSAPAIVRGKEIPLTLTPDEFKRLLRGLQGIEAARDSVRDHGRMG